MNREGRGNGGVKGGEEHSLFFHMFHSLLGRVNLFVARLYTPYLDKLVRVRPWFLDRPGLPCASLDKYGVGTLSINRSSWLNVGRDVYPKTGLTR